MKYETWAEGRTSALGVGPYLHQRWGHKMLQTVLDGLMAGVIGTVALNMTTYADMAIRGRPASNVPAKLIGTQAEDAGIKSLANNADSDTASNRRSGLGAIPFK